MTNSLRKLAKDLKAFAKRCKDFKYTEQALFVFLLCGIVGFADVTTAPTDKAIQNQRQEITTSIGDMRQQFKRVKSENDKLMKNYNLELIQLMEQGDHVVKSPWSSWQYGINTFYNDWRGTYKGKGNKIKDNGVYKRSQTLSRYLESPVIEKNANNTTTLGFVYEPNAEIPISASITPKSISKTNPNIQKNVAIASLPSFEPRVVVEPLAPSAPKSPQINLPEIAINADSDGNSGRPVIDGNADNGSISEVAITGGKFNVIRSGDRNWEYEYQNYSGKNSFYTTAATTTTGRTVTDPWTNWTENSRTGTGKLGFQSVVGSYNTGTTDIGAGMLSNGDFLYTYKEANSPYLREFVHQDVHNAELFATQRTEFQNASAGLSNQNDILKAHDDVTGLGLTANQNIVTGGAPIRMHTWINSGTVVIEGSNTSLGNTYSHGGSGLRQRRQATINVGKIVLQPYKTTSGDIHDQNTGIFIISPAVSVVDHAVAYNGETGIIKDYTRNTAGLATINSAIRPVSMINRGILQFFGEKSAVVYTKNPVNLDLQFTKDNTFSFNQNTTTSADYKPAEIFGDYSVGLYNVATSGTTEGNFAVNIGALNTGNSNFTTTERTNGGVTDYDLNPTDTALNPYNSNPALDKHPEYIRNSFGILSNSSIDLTSHQIEIFDKTESNVGVMPNANVLLNLGGGNIELKGGNSNIGIYVVDKYTNGGTTVTPGGAVKSTGDVKLDGGKGNLAIYAKGSNRPSAVNETVSVRKVTSNNTENSVAIFASDDQTSGVDGSVVKVTGGIEVKNATVSANPTIAGKENAGAVYAIGKGTSVTIDMPAISPATTPVTPTIPNIEVKGKEIVTIDPVTGATTGTGNYTGFGLYAGNGAQISAKYNNIKVEDGGTAVASVGSAGATNSKVDLSGTATTPGSTVEYNGKGYALFSKDNGEIDLSYGTLTLRGEATGYSTNVTLTPQPITLTGATLNVFSNDVIVANLKGVSTFNTNGSIINGANSIGTYIPIASIVNTDPATGTTYNGYKYTVLDGITVNIDSNIDKADTTATPAPSDSYIFTRRLQLQNSNLNVASGNTVKAHLNTTEINDINSKLTVPVGLDISASGNSTSRSTTGVNVANGATITVDRTDSGNGGVGAYVNYGTVTNNGKIEVEKLTPNDHAVGIYATNGTIVNNNTTGTVEVGGKDSIGILGLSYRIDSKNNVVYEKFSTGGVIVPNGIGHVDITNKGKITLDGDNALGIYAKNNSLDATGVNAGYLRSSTSDTSATNDGEITLAGKNAIGMITEGGQITNDSNGKITINGQEGVAMYGTVAKDSATPTVNKVHSQLINKGTITLADTTATTPIIGMFTNDPDTSITTSGTINVGKKSYGVYGASNNVSMTGGTINVGDDGVGIFATGSSDTTTPTSTVNLSGGTITVGTNKAVGVFIADDANHPLKTTVNNTGTNVNVGNDSFGYVVDSTTGTDLILGSATNKLTSSLDTDSVYVYSNDKNGFVYSNTDITTNGGKIYGLYTAGRAENYGNMDLRGGTGNVGIYSTGTSPTGAGATNYGTITVGGTNVNVTPKEYGIGMATGYYNETTGAISNEGLIENRGTLNVVGENSIGMYAVGSGSKAINAAGATIDISGKNATGMYIDHGAEGINYGTIKSTGSATGIKGVATVNGGYIKNYGTIAITSPDGIGIYQDAASSLANKNVPGNVSGTKKAVYTATSTDEKYIVSPKGSLLIQNPPRTPRLVVNGKEVELRGLDTNVASPTPSYVTAGVTTLDLSLPEFAEFKNSPSNAQASELGMYIDTSGVNYTNPIQGLNNLIGLDAVNLIIGTEAAKYTDAKAIEIGDNILTPYNNAISSLTTTGTKLNINAAGLTWLAQPVQGATKPIETLYMVKIPYTYFTSPKDENTYNFLDGLEQRYGVDGYGARGAREKLLFNKLNGIGKGETHIFTQAVDEMKGHQYANTQQRINETGSLLDEEFKYLHDEWRNPSKQNNKIKIFGIRNEYNTDTAGIIDYTSNAYGVAYVHEDETVKLGNSSGWYAGAVNNRFRFKDNGKSKENQTMLKAGIFKTMSPYMDHNGSLRWTVAGDVFVGQNEMKRRFLVVDDIFSAKGDYTSYGAAFKTDLGYDIRMSERTHLRPYGALKMEYGRFNNIKEDDGEMRLEVKGNDYFSVKPEVGVQFKYVQPLAVRTQLSVGLTAAYENELGKLQERRNQARVGYTDAGWYNLEQEKENRRGNGKFDFNLGVDNTRFGVTVNAGYDTKGSNIRGGIGFRAIY